MSAQEQEMAGLRSERTPAAGLRRGAALVAAAALAWCCAGSSAAAQFSDGSARIMPAGQVELGVFGPLKVGLSDDLQLEAQPLLFFVMPQLEGRYRLLHEGAVHLAVEAELSYPTLLLSLLAKNGIGGLVSPDSDIPPALMIAVRGVASLDHGAGRISTARLGVEVAPRGSSQNFAVLDFPFLYPRFAALHAPFVPYAELRSEGVLVGALDYLASARLFGLLTDFPGAAFEAELGLRWRVDPRIALSARVWTSVAAYPYGTQFHWFPMLEAEFIIEPGTPRE